MAGESLRRVLFVSGTPGSNTLRYRVRLAEEALRSRGVRTHAMHYTDPRTQAWLSGTDVLALYRTPMTPLLGSLIRRARASGTPITFDIDDLVFAPDHQKYLPFVESMKPKPRREFLRDLPLRGLVVESADRASGTSMEIVDRLSAICPCPVELIPNGVGRVGLAAADRVQPRQPHDNEIVLGYFSGSATHDADWAVIERFVVELMHRDPRVRLRLVGPLRTSSLLDSVRERVDQRAAVTWLELFELLASVDINLAPLHESPFAEAKSAIKWLESALVRTPTIATATGPFAAAIDDRQSGLLAWSVQDWPGLLDELVDSASCRRAIGEQARHSALAEFGPDRQADRYLTYFRDALNTGSLGGNPVQRRVSYTPGVDLEPYPFTSDISLLGWRPSSLSRRAWQTRQSAANLAQRARSKTAKSLHRKAPS